MNSAKLIEKLVAIEQAVGHVPASQIRVMLADLEDDILRVNRDYIATLDELMTLRQAAAQQSRGGPKRATPAPVFEPATRKPPQSSPQPADAQPQHDLDLVRHMLLAVAQ